MDLELDRVKCTNPKCKNIFGVANSKQKFCSMECKWEAKELTPEEWKEYHHTIAIMSAPKEKTGNYGMPELGGAKRALKKEENAKTDLGKTLAFGSGLTNTKERNGPRMAPQSKENGSAERNITTKTKRSLIENEKNAGKETARPQEKEIGNGMQKTEVITSPKKKSEENGETQQLDSLALYKKLDEENVGSVKQLNNSIKTLVGMAQRLAEGMTDEEGQVIRKPTHFEVDQVLKCLEGARNVAKTKLDYLKFAKEISNANTSGK